MNNKTKILTNKILVETLLLISETSKTLALEVMLQTKKVKGDKLKMNGKLDIEDEIKTNCNLLLSNQDFSTALSFLKDKTDDFHIARKGWNGKGLEVILRKGYLNGIPCNENTANVYGLKVGDKVYCEPYFQIHDKNTHKVNTWVPSVSDLLAEDWEVF